MADTKISALTAVGTPAGTDEYATNQGGVSKKTTLAQVKTFVNAAPVFAAGSAGTMIPSIDQVTAAAATLAAGSYFWIKRIGSTSVVSVGQWD